MKQELKQLLATGGKRVRKKKERDIKYAKRLQVPITEAQWELLMVEADVETEGNIAQLARKKLFPKAA